MVEVEITKSSDNADDAWDRKHRGIPRSGKVTFEQRPSEYECVWWQKVLAERKAYAKVLRQSERECKRELLGLGQEWLKTSFYRLRKGQKLSMTVT